MLTLKICVSFLFNTTQDNFITQLINTDAEEYEKMFLKFWKFNIYTLTTCVYLYQLSGVPPPPQRMLRDPIHASFPLTLSL